MRKFCLLLLLSSLPVPTLANPAAEGDGLAYPATRTAVVTDNYGAVAVDDPYRWLEADVRSSQEVKTWAEQQNAFARSYLDGIAARGAIRDRVDRLANLDQISVPVIVGRLQFYMLRAAGEQQASYWVRRGEAGAARKLIDPRDWSADGSAALAAAIPSHDGRRVAFALQQAGSDWRTWHVLDVKSGTVLPDRVKWNKFSDISWDADGSGFYYTRFPEPKAGEEYRAGNRGAQFYRHRIGDAQQADQLVYENRAEPDHMFIGRVSNDGRFLIINSGYNGGGPDVRIRAAKKKGDFEPLFPGEKEGTRSYRFAGQRGAQLLFLTNENAPNGRVVAIDMRDPKRAVRAVIAEADHPLIAVNLGGGRFFARYLEDAKSKIVVYNMRGKALREVSLPDMGTAGGFAGAPTDRSVYFSFTSFTIPTSIYRYDIASGKTSIVSRPSAPLSPGDYRVEQVFFTARDGKRIPMYLASRKSTVLTPDTPVLLYGYGGFNLSFAPDYRPEQVAWMDMGGIFAFPTLPGGGEYGDAWHRAGMLERKPAVFDAFVDAAEYLIGRGITRPGRLAAFGYSNGGLLIGAVMTRRPDLFAVALPNVGVLDMLRFPEFTNGRLWGVEYGLPSDPRMFPVLRGYSPYHNIAANIRYPATLVSTADTDDRVYPAHSFKFAARLQAMAQPGRPVLLTVATKAGHGAGMARSQIVETAADRLSFTMENMAITLPSDFGTQEASP